MTTTDISPTDNRPYSLDAIDERPTGAPTFYPSNVPTIAPTSSLEVVMRIVQVCLSSASCRYCVTLLYSSQQVQGLQPSDFDNLPVMNAYISALSSALNIPFSWIEFLSVGNVSLTPPSDSVAIFTVVTYPEMDSLLIPTPLQVEATLNDSLAINGTMNFTCILKQKLSQPSVISEDPGILALLDSVMVALTVVTQLSYAPSKSPSLDNKSSIGIPNDKQMRNDALISVFSVVGFVVFCSVALYMRNLFSHKRAAEVREWEDVDLQTEFGFLSYPGSALSSSSFHSHHRIGWSSYDTNSIDDVYIDI